jgi:uncharacterized protein YkwD
VCFCFIAGAQDSAVVDEVNILRANPGKYADILESRLRYYQGNVLKLPGRLALQTTEGPSVVKEAILDLRARGRIPTVKRITGLERSADEHVRDIGPKGLVQHKGLDGSEPADREGRHTADISAVGEVISFGPGRARDVVLDLVVDDGVRGRDHRKILLDPSFRLGGAACGPHATYGTMCVIDLASPRQAEPRRR